MKEADPSQTALSRIDYSVVIPVFNSENTLQDLTERIIRTFSSLEKHCEIIFVDDESTDSSWEVLRRLRRNNPETVKIIRLRRNFGQHNALMCGFHYCRGNYVITLDDDLQNPPEEIPSLFEKAGEGNEVVYGIYRKKAHSPIKNFGSRLIGWYYRRVFGMDNRISAFRLISKDIIDRIIHYDKNFTYIDGLISWNTSSIGEADVSHSPRARGRSGYNLAKIMKLAFNMLTNFSAFPIRIVSVLGLIFALFGFGLGIYFFCKALIANIPVTGYASLIVAVTTFSGVQLLTIGVIGEYIARVHININKKPQYVIKEKSL